MEGRQERAEPLDRAHDLSSLSGEVEAVARGDRSMQQCRTCSADRHGQVIDPFGHRWGISQHLRDVPPEEVTRAAAAVFGGEAS